MNNKPKSRRHSNSSSAAMTPVGDVDSIEETVEEASVLSPVDSEPNEFKRHKKRLKSRTIREEFEIKKSDDTDKEVSDKLNPLDIGSLNIAQNSTDLLKLAKVKSSKKSDEMDEIKYRVKLTQAMQKDRTICEYVGHVLFVQADTTDCYNYTFKIPISADNKPSSSSISSSSTANLNDTLETICVCIDSSKVFNNSRYIRKSCKYNSRLVPVKDTCGNLKFFIQTIESVGKNSEIFLAPDLNNVNNSVCLCEMTECELRHKLSCKAVKKSLKKPERRSSAHSPPPLLALSHDDSFKCLSREDRKLASYVRVIEKLEKQVKRKKEIKPRDHSDKCDADKCTKETNEKENDKNKKSKANRPSLLSKHEPTAEPVDQEIASINERPAPDDDIKSNVKSPDYSFVNLSIQPRHTLNLLQRNLANDERFSPALESLENNKTFLTNKSFFHPKKHWLKTCCSNENSQSELSPSKSESSQPPKKRRFVVEQSTLDTHIFDHLGQNVETTIQQQTPPQFSPDQFYINYLPTAAILNTSLFAPNPIYNTFNPYAALSLYQNLMPAINQPGSQANEAQPENTKKKVSLAEYRQRKESIKPSDTLFESISSNKSFSNDDSLCELDVYPTEDKKSRNSSCSSCSSRCTRNASLSDISDVSSVRSRSPSTSSQRSHTSRFESYQKGLKRKRRSCSLSRIQQTNSSVSMSDQKRSSSLNRPRKFCRVEAKFLNSLSKSFGSCSSSLSIYSSNDVSTSTAKTHL